MSPHSPWSAYLLVSIRSKDGAHDSGFPSKIATKPGCLCQTKSNTSPCSLDPEARTSAPSKGFAHWTDPTSVNPGLAATGKVSVKPRLARTHALPALSQTPLVRHPARPPPDGSGASEAPGRSARGGADRAHINLGLTAEGDPLSTKSRLRTIFLLPAGAFSEKRQVAKFDLIEKSFLTVILCYCAQRVSVEAGLANMGSHQSWLNRDKRPPCRAPKVAKPSAFEPNRHPARVHQRRRPARAAAAETEEGARHCLPLRHTPRTAPAHLRRPIWFSTASAAALP